VLIDAINLSVRGALFLLEGCFKIDYQGGGFKLFKFSVAYFLFYGVS
jgi:hypothetical protein